MGIIIWEIYIERTTPVNNFGDGVNQKSAEKPQWFSLVCGHSGEGIIPKNGDQAIHNFFSLVMRMTE
jgi:hypothetical protein